MAYPSSPSFTSDLPIGKSILKELIYEGLDMILAEDEIEEDYHIRFRFGLDTSILLTYSSVPFWEDKLTSLPNSDFSLKYVRINSVISDPVEIIEKIFHPIDYKNLSFQFTDFELEPTIIPRFKKNYLKRQKYPGLNDPSLSEIIVDRMICRYENEGKNYKLNRGFFGSIIKDKKTSIGKRFKDKLSGTKGTVHPLNIHQVLPFTEKEKELLSSLKSFDTGYRFPRPYLDEDFYNRAHLFSFTLRKKEDNYELEMEIREGFLSGFDLEALWPAENLFDYLSSKKTFVPFDEEIKPVRVHRRVESGLGFCGGKTVYK